MKRGFTLIELLVVISIIGLLASVILVSLGMARENARNAARISTIKQYQLALELYYDSHGEYPNPLNAALLSGPGQTGAWTDSAIVCLGDYVSNVCVDNGWYSFGSRSENASLLASLSPYIKNQRVDETPVALYGNSQSYVRGAFYACEYMQNGKCPKYNIFFALEGANRDCPGGFYKYFYNDGAYSVCDTIDWE